MQPWQQPRSQNIVTPAEARIVNEAGILHLCALQSRQNGEGLNCWTISFFKQLEKVSVQLLLMLGAVEK